jgi:hypothetical protein
MVFWLASGALLAQNTGAPDVTASPALYPAFNPAITDYVVHGTFSTPVYLSISPASGTQVSVDGQPFQSRPFTAVVGLNPGQSFSFVVNSTAGTTLATYYVRLLPSDFPLWTAERLGSPQVEWYVVSPSFNLNTTATQNYAIVFDGFGVPVWWYRTDTTPYDTKLLPNGTLAWALKQGYEERRLDGTLARTVQAVEGTMDTHELLLLPNGNTVFIEDLSREHIDLTPLGGKPDSTVIDNIVREVAPDGSLVWSWDAMDHIPFSEIDGSRFPEIVNWQDPYHMNSVEPDGDGYIVSFRHLDAVYKIDRATGNILWKLGGSPRPESLAFQGDFYSNFGGQHDARLLPDGTLTVHDNGTNRGRAPRAARFALNLSKRTATRIEQVTDDVLASPCCGDARKLPGGDWVIDWGGSPYVTELAPSGKRVFRLTFGDFSTYRVAPVPFGTLSRSDLRNGMDAQFPRSARACQPGNLDGDGEINVSDALLLLRSITGLTRLDPDQTRAADVNQDHRVNISDVLLILRAIAQLSPLPDGCASD